MKNSSYFPSLTTGNAATKPSLSQEINHPLNINKSLDHKKRIIEYDRRKKELNDILLENSKKRVERYPGVKDDDEAVRTISILIFFHSIKIFFFYIINIIFF